MTHQDISYLKLCAKLGLVKSPFLEIGAAKVQGEHNFCDLARDLGVGKTWGVDLSPGKGVDATFDFSVPRESFRGTWTHGRFATVVVFNVLEHTFDPIGVLANALECVEPGGALLVVTPAVWPIHLFPKDFCRLLPDWYVEFARRHDLTLVREGFLWLSQFGLTAIGDEARAQFPSYLEEGRGQTFRYWRSRVLHRVFDTFARTHPFAHAAIGAAFTRRA